MEVCRICANCSEFNCRDLFETTDCSVQELNFIHEELEAWQLRVVQNDGLPQKICSNCFTSFCTILAFRRNCETAYQKHQQVLLDDLRAEAQSSISNDFLTIAAQLPDKTTKFRPHGFVNITLPENPNVAISAPYVLMVPIKRDCTFYSTMPSVNSEKSQVSQEQSNSVAVNDLMEIDQRSTLPTERKYTTAELTNCAHVSNSVAELNDDDSDDNKDDEMHANKASLRNYPYTCTYCYCPKSGSIDHLVFEDADSLSLHLFNEHEPNHPYTCGFCCKAYEYEKQRDNHVLYLHAEVEVDNSNISFAESKILLHECRECDEKFAYKKDLREHMLYHSELSVHCSEMNCDFKCLNEKALTKHIRLQHCKITCEYCGHQFSLRRLDAHRREVHGADA